MDMTRSAMELYLYMGSSDEIIKWLEEEGCETKQQALDKLEPLVGSNIRSWAGHIGSGEYGVSLAGTSSCVEKVIKHFETKNQ